MPLSTSISINVDATLLATLDLVTATAPLAFRATASFTDGSGAGQASNIFSDTRSLAASANETIDLNGSLLNALGSTINLTKVKALIISADSANVNDVVVGPNSTNGFVSPFNAAADRLKIKPGGSLALVAPDANGYAVTAGTADLLYVGNAGGGSAVNYNIIIIGA